MLKFFMKQLFTIRQTWLKSLDVSKLINFVLYTSLLFLGYGYQIITKWQSLDLNGMKPVRSFNDLNWVLNSAKCFKEIGIAVYDPNNSVCAQYNYNYGRSLLYALNFFHFDPSMTVSLGITATITVVIGISLIISSSAVGERNSSKILLLLIFFSPPVWLTIALTNFDELIFVLLILAAVSISLHKEVLGTLLIGLATLVKFYTLPVLLVLVVIFKSKRSKSFSIFLFFFCGLAIIPDVALYYNKENYVGGSNTWWASWGAPWPGHFLNLFTPYISPNFPLINSLLSYLLGIILLISTVILIKKTSFLKSSELKFSEKNDSHFLTLNNKLFWLFGSTVTFMFLTGMTMDYRLFFLLTAGCALFGCLEKGSHLKRVILILVFITAWGSFGGYGSWTGVLHFAGILGKLLSDISATFLMAFILESMRKNFSISKVFKSGILSDSTQ